MQEIRHLVFDARELQELTLGYLEAQGQRPTVNGSGSTWDLVETGTGLRLTVSSLAQRAIEPREIVFGTGDLLSAAILFCKKRRVPLPMRGQKRITLLQGSLALVVAI